MIRRFRPRLSYANVMSSIAVFAVLGGGAYAHHRNSVGPQQIQRDAVKKRHIDRNTVAAKELRPRAVRPGIVAPNAIRTQHLFDGAVTADKLAPGVEISGPQGPAGPQGEQGPPGQDGADGSPDSPAQVLSKLAQVDGPGSGLDADLLDGRDSTQFTRFAGRVLSNGTVAQGEGFSASRSGTGLYAISFPAGTFPPQGGGGCSFAIPAIAPFTGVPRFAGVTGIFCNNDGNGSAFVHSLDLGCGRPASRLRVLLPRAVGRDARFSHRRRGCRHAA
jgi:hypothetical protein